VALIRVDISEDSSASIVLDTIVGESNTVYIMYTGISSHRASVGSYS
jgi:hypothetical protein